MKTFKHVVLICTALMSGFMFTACSEDETSENGGNGNSEAKSELYTTRPIYGAGFTAAYDEKGLLTGYYDENRTGANWEVVSYKPLKLKSYETYGDASESYEATFTQNKNGIITAGKVVFKGLYPEDNEEETETISFKCSYNDDSQLSKLTISFTGQEKEDGYTETQTIEGTATLSYSEGKLIKSTASYNVKDEDRKYTLNGTTTYSYEDGVDNKMKQFGYNVINTAVPSFSLAMFAPLLEIGMFGTPSAQLPSVTLLSENISVNGNSMYETSEEIEVSYAMNEDGTIKTENGFCTYSEDGYQSTDSFTFDYTYWFAPNSNQTIKQNVPSNAKRTRGFFKFPCTKRIAL